MLSGDNSILQKATEAKEITDKNQIVEQARLDILGELADKKGEDPTETKIIEILGTYFKEDTIPEDLSDLNQVMKTKSGGYTVKLSEVLNGVTINQEVKETHIAKSTNYVGYYADMDDDGYVDGIIYADMITGNTKSGKWNNNSRSSYSITKITDTTTVKDYVISSKTYKGQTTPGKYKANDGFGVQDVIVPAKQSEGTNDRFYIMQLTDFTNNSKDRFYWYYDAYNKKKLDRVVASSVNDFGQGKQNTINMIDDWTNKTSTYGGQTTASSGKDYIDLWGAIQTKPDYWEQDRTYDYVKTATDSKKWFVPSRAEWSAFGEELEITTEGYEKCGLSEWYWSSSQYDTYSAYLARFDYGCIGGDSVNDLGYVRLSTTF